MVRSLFAFSSLVPIARSIVGPGGGAAITRGCGTAAIRDVARGRGGSAALEGAAAPPPRMKMAPSSSDGDDSDRFLAPTLARARRELRSQKRAEATGAARRSRASAAADGIAAASDSSRSMLAEGGLAADGWPALDPGRNTRHAPLVYHDRYSCPGWPAKHTFPMAKFRETAASLLGDPDEFLASGGPGEGDRRPLVLSPDHFHRPLPAGALPPSLLSPPLRPSFVRAFLAGALSAEERRAIGFREQTPRPELIERTLLEVAGTLLAAQLALRHGLAGNLAGGTHHAEAGRGKGFTILNDLAVTTRLLTWKEGDVVGGDGGDARLLRQLYRGDGGASVDRVLVVDCDVHQGDGTATFSYAGGGLRDRLFTLDLHAANNYPHPKERCTYDVPLPDGCGDGAYLAALRSSLSLALEEVRPQLVLYNAGVDAFGGDKLGRLDLSAEGMRRRDRHVIETCVDKGIPTAAVVGGGYDDDASALGSRHALVHRVCAEVWRERRMWARNAGGAAR